MYIYIGNRAVSNRKVIHIILKYILPEQFETHNNSKHIILVAECTIF